MFSLLYLMIKLMIATVVLSLWLMWALIALPVMLIASATGNQRSARSWQRSLRWRRVF